MTKLTRQGAQSCVNDLSLMAYFPSDAGSRAALVGQVEKMVTFNEQAEWLAYRGNQVFSTWPGFRELRALFCKRFQPKDGVEVGSQIYPEGFPSEAVLGPVPVAGLLPSMTEREAIEAPRMRLLPAPREKIEPVDPEAAKLLEALAREVSAPRPRVRRGRGGHEQSNAPEGAKA